MAAKKKTEVYKSAAAMKKHEKGEGKKEHKAELKAGVKNKVAKASVKKMTAPKRIAKSI